MSDWENIFGADASADSVIDSINQSWESEWRGAEREERNERKRSLTAFRGDFILKAKVKASLAEFRSGDRLIGDDGGLKCLLKTKSQLGELWDRYRIPAALALLADAVFWGLQRDTCLSEPTAKEQENAMDWLFEFVDAIEPGTDLRFVTAKIAVRIVQNGLRLPASGQGRHTADEIRSFREECKPALQIIYARARGVVVPLEMAKAAAYKAAGPRWCLGYGDDDVWSASALYNSKDYASEMVASAVWPSMQSITVATQWAVRGEVEARLFGDGNHGCAWSVYGDELLALVRSAPTERIQQISIDRICSGLGLKLITDVAPA